MGCANVWRVNSVWGTTINITLEIICPNAFQHALVTHLEREAIPGRGGCTWIIVWCLFQTRAIITSLGRGRNSFWWCFGCRLMTTNKTRIILSVVFTVRINVFDKVFCFLDEFDEPCHQSAARSVGRFLIVFPIGDAGRNIYIQENKKNKKTHIYNLWRPKTFFYENRAFGAGNKRIQCRYNNGRSSSPLGPPELSFGPVKKTKPDASTGIG